MLHLLTGDSDSEPIGITIDPSVYDVSKNAQCNKIAWLHSLCPGFQNHLDFFCLRCLLGYFWPPTAKLPSNHTTDERKIDYYCARFRNQMESSEVRSMDTYRCFRLNSRLVKQHHASHIQYSGRLAEVLRYEYAYNGTMT